MTDRSMKEVLEILARDVGELADFARNLEHTVLPAPLLKPHRETLKIYRHLMGLSSIWMI